jgi:hypothetical protein
VSEPSHNDLAEQGRAVVLLTRPELIVSPGDASELAVSESSGVGDAIVGYYAGEIRKLFLDGAEGEDLAKLVLDRYGIVVPDATAATTQVTLTRVTTGAGTVPAGTRVATPVAVDGTFQVFTTIADLVFSNAQLTGTVGVSASLSGSDGNVDAGTLTRVLDTVFATFTVTNAQAAAGGHERMTDPEVRDLARSYVKSLRKGTIFALETGARQVPQVRVATVIENGPGLVTLYVSDAFGASNTQMVSDVQREIDSGAVSGTDGWRGAGVIVTAAGGAVVLQSIAFTLTVRAGVDAAALVDAARAAVVTAVNRLRFGETLFVDLIKAAAKSIAPDSIVAVTVTTPAANIAPQSGQLLRTALAIVSGS